MHPDSNTRALISRIVEPFAPWAPCYVTKRYSLLPGRKDMQTSNP